MHIQLAQAELLERDAHTIGGWLTAFAQDGPAALAFEQAGCPPALGAEAQAGLKVAVQATPEEAGIALANWNWKVVRQFIEARCGIRLCRSACLRYLHRLGFVYKRPKKGIVNESRVVEATDVAGKASPRCHVSPGRGRRRRSAFASVWPNFRHHRGSSPRSRAPRARRGAPPCPDSAGRTGRSATRRGR